MNTAAPARTLAAVASAALLAAFVAAPVLAHASLVKSDPAASAVLDVSPTTITLTFDETLVPAKSSFKLAGASASDVVGAVTPSNTKVMQATGVALTPGVWKVQWTAFSTDGHLERGSYSFTIAVPTPAPATPAPTLAPTAAPTVATTVAPTTAPVASPTAEPTPAPSAAPAGNDASDSGSALLAVVAALAAVAAAAWFLFGRGRRA